MRSVRFVDLGKQYQGLRDELVSEFDAISAQGAYILGDAVDTFERAFAEFCETPYAISVANGSDALFLSLKALGVGEDDEVITTPNTFIASAATIARTGARIVFCDVGEDLNMSPGALDTAMTANT